LIEIRGEQRSVRVENKHLTILRTLLPNLTLIPPLLSKRAKGSQIAVPLPLWERAIAYGILEKRLRH
jgi:hypothetical protein